MGVFNYKCKCCNKVIGIEVGLFMHVRSGKVIGTGIGHYDGYGRISEEEGLPEKYKFRGNHDGINGHMEVWKSEFEKDSMSGIVAWHKQCFDNATEEERNELRICEGGQW